MKHIDSNLTELTELRNEFVTDFNRHSIEKMTIEDYAMGDGGKENFCYRIERQLKDLGNIAGSQIQKFGVWFSKEENQYKYTQKWGNSVDDAFKNIRKSLCDLFDAGLKDDWVAIRNNGIAPTVRSKILAIYYPDRYLTIHSIEHLRYFCDKLKIAYSSTDDELILQKLLISCKEKDKNTCNLSLIEFAIYLYDTYGHPPKDGETRTPPSKPKTPPTPPEQEPSILEKLKKSYETLKKSTREKKVITTTTQNKERKKLIGDIVKEIANGVCQLCNQPAPFVNKDQRPYLECHHVQWLERGGADDVYNAVAICPNCHKKMHILDLEQDVKILEKVAKKNMTSFNSIKKAT